MPDFGCYITVFNECPSSLNLSSETIVDGNWKIPPPQVIPNGQNYQFVLEDDLGPEGSEGFATYNLEGTSASVVLHFSCPVWSSNIFNATSNNTVILNVTQTGPNGGHPLLGKVPHREHTLHHYYLSYSPLGKLRLILICTQVLQHAHWHHSRIHPTPAELLTLFQRNGTRQNLLMKRWSRSIPIISPSLRLQWINPQSVGSMNVSRHICEQLRLSVFHSLPCELYELSYSRLSHEAQYIYIHALMRL